MLEFIFGRPKSGKTTEIINRIAQCVKENKRTYLLVPEQQVHISETMIASMLPESWKCFEVITFSGLCDMVFERYGGLTKKSVGDNVRHLLMWYSTNQVSEMLEGYKQNKNDTSFSDMMLSAITELSVLGITPEGLEEIIESADDEQFKKKFTDIALIYASFKANISTKLGGVALKEELQKSALEKLHKNKLFDGACIFVDSFTDFTGVEEALLCEIIKSADNTVISINLPHRGYDLPHAKSIRNTLKELTSYARNNSIETVDTVIDERQVGIHPELARIEKHLWNFSISSKDVEAMPKYDTHAVSLTECKNAYEEAEYVAIKILEEKASGTAFSNMSIIMRDAESYKGIIDAVFDKYHIPYFYSEKTDISTTSAARYILSSLRAIATGFRLDDIMTLVKTGLCPITNEECDMFEDYCTTWSINGRGFTAESFNMNPDGYSTRISERGKTILEASNKVKDIIIPPLEELRQKISVAKNAKESLIAILEYIERTELSGSVLRLCELELADGNVRECSEQMRIYDYIIDSIVSLADILGDDELKIGEIITALSIMFAHTDIASVPQIDEYVTIGSASTLRVENIKVAFVMGLCEGEFPKPATEHGILKENDKNILDKLGIKVTSTLEKASGDELYFVYNAFTKPTDRLYLTSPTFGVDGRAKAFSVAWNRIMFILGKSKGDIESFSLGRIREYTNDIPKKDDTPVLVEAIDPMRARLIFGDSIKLSKSQIATFTLCPYRYWCENVLNLRENKSSKINPADIGTLVHYVLEKYLSEHKTSNGDVIHKDNSYIFSKASEIVERYISEIGFAPSPSALYALSRYRNTAYYMLCSIDEEFKESDFKIISLEENISDRAYSRLKPMLIEVPVSEDFSPNVVLGGTVDRIDMYRDGEVAYLRIVDYKTGTDTFNVDKISEGHDIQLPIYLFAVTDKRNENSKLFSSTIGDAENVKITPASALFLSVNEKDGKVKPFRSGFILNDEKLIAATNHSLDKSFIVGNTKGKNEDGSPKNYLNAEKMDGVRETLKSTISDIAKNIYSGLAPRCPSDDACAFCKIKGQCPVAKKDKKF